MTDTNPRYLLTEHEALLARLSDVLWNNGLNKAAREADAAVERLHNFLAQPQPRGLTDEEIADEARKYLVNEYTLPAEITYFLDSDNFEYEPTIGCFRAVLARWGHPTPQPVPVSERLPGREDCDAEGRCWWGRPSEELCNSDWFLATRAEVDEFCDAWPPIVFLPHWALPVPIKAS